MYVDMDARKRGSNIVFTVAGLSAALGILALVGFTHAVMKARKARASWVQVPATVTRAEVEEYRHRWPDDPPGYYRLWYRPKCMYAYTFEGQSYTSTRLSVAEGGGNASRRDGAERLVAPLREHMSSGTPIPAFVDPQDPSRAVIFFTISGAKPVAVFAIIFLGVAALLVRYGLRLRRKPPAY